MTTDIDAVMLGGELTISETLRVLASRAIDPRIDDAEAFAQHNLVLLLVHRPTGEMTKFGRTLLPMARPEDLVVFKAIAARPKDVEDAVALLLMHPNIDLAATRRRVAELATLAESPELLEGLEAMIATAARATE
jgi:hypothetical protein